MFFQRIFTPYLSINSYLLGDEKSKRCVVVDPTRHVVPFVMHAQNAGLDITDILETHVHADYISGSRELKHQLNGKPRIYASEMGGKKWLPSYVDIIVREGTKVKIGELRLEAIHTPGHTPEHVIWVCYDESRSFTTPWFAFTGDCLFVGSIGRPDLLGQKEMAVLAPMLYKTLFEVLAPLPDFLEIFPGHGEGSFCGRSLRSRANSTLGYERLFNAYFKRKSQENWIDQLKEEHLPIPSYFQRLKKVNVQGPSLLNVLKVEVWNPKKNKPNLNDIFLLDVRHPELFATSHIKNSLNIPLSPSFCQWAGWMLPGSTPIGLVIEKNCIYSEIIDHLRLMGFDQDIWVIPLEENHQQFTGSSSSFLMMDIEELAKQQPNFESLYVLDVRSSEEWQAGHIPGTHHLELHHLEGNLNQLPRSCPIVLLCRSGHRASLAASLLQKHGFSSLINVRGGIQAWKQASLPIRVGCSNY